jgi:hypothetical protein
MIFCLHYRLPHSLLTQAHSFQTSTINEQDTSTEAAVHAPVAFLGNNFHMGRVHLHLHLFFVEALPLKQK